MLCMFGVFCHEFYLPVFTAASLIANKQLDHTNIHSPASLAHYIPDFLLNREPSKARRMKPFAVFCGNAIGSLVFTIGSTRSAAALSWSR